MRTFRRAKFWLHRCLIPILTVIACSALFLSTFAVVRYTQIQDSRQEERTAYDAQSCERGNHLREDIKDLGVADAQLVRDILTAFGAGADDFALLTDSFRNQMKAVDAIEITDCLAALNRAKENT